VNRDRGQRVFYRCARAIVLTLFKVVFRVRISGRGYVPRRGAFVVAPSHRSLMDIFFTCYVSRRRIRFMAKQELFEKQPLAWLFGTLGGFPVARGSADRGALRAARTALEGGEPVAVFPEGTRHSGPVIGDLFDGAAYLAAQRGVSVVPVAIAGSEEILPSGRSVPRLHRVAIVIGRPVMPAAPEDGGRVPRSEVARMTEALHAELQARFDEASRRAGTERR